MFRLHRVAPLVFLAATAVALTFVARPASTVPLYAARTGLMCQSCHFDPNGGGPRNEFGFNFAKNRHALTPEEAGDWKDLNLKNRVGDDFPLYFGVNQRFMLLGNKLETENGLDRSGFWNMENAIYATFQPHPKLTLVYNLEQAFGSNYQSRDAFALLGLGSSHYLKAGQFRVPFGLRMDDHTVATRNSFLDFQTGEAFLPFDPRNVDRGVELGGTRGDFFGRASFTNGSSITSNGPANDRRHPQAFAAKLGYAHAGYQGGLSFYDDWRWQNTSTSTRAMRWGYYAMGHLGPLAAIGEIAAGTDAQTAGGAVARRNSLAGFIEADWAPHRAYNVRVRYDRLELDRGSDDFARAQNSYNRYAVEGEWVPVPFAELRWTFRVIDPVADDDGFGTVRESEKQGYLQLHVSY